METLNSSWIVGGEKQFAKRTVVEACFRERRCQY